MSLAGSQQSDFSAGAAPGNERVSSRGVEDCVNGIYQDDGTILKRGGCSYVLTADMDYADIFTVWAGQLVPGERLVALGEDPTGGGTGLCWYTKLAAVTGTFPTNAFGNDPFAVSDASRLGFNRPTAVGGLLFVTRRGYRELIAFADAVQATVTTSQLLTFTNGSTSVTGSGTSFTSHVSAGTILADSTPAPPLTKVSVVKSVESNTALTLTAPWPHASGSYGTKYYRNYSITPPRVSGAVTADNPAMVIGTAYDRLIVGAGRYLDFSLRSNPVYFADGDYHELPEGVDILGIEQVQDAVIVFTTDGVWAVTGMALDLTDDYGNVQHRVERINRDIVLWEDNGIASGPGGVIVPALDDIYRLGLGGADPIAGGIRKRYREYVKAGYIPGQAAAHRGHYFLPVLSPASDSEWVDTLVCNLSTGAWSRWGGYGGKVRALTQRTRSGSPAQLCAAAGAGATDSRRVVDLAGCFEPSSSNKQDADASTFSLKVAFRALTAGTLPVLWHKIRVAYTHLDASSDNPTLTAQYAVDQESSFTSLYDGSDTSQTASATESVDAIQWWNIRKRARSIRLQITSSGPTSKLVIRGVETLYRPIGRR